MSDEPGRSWSGARRMPSRPACRRRAWSCTSRASRCAAYGTYARLMPRLHSIACDGARELAHPALAIMQRLGMHACSSISAQHMSRAPSAVASEVQAMQHARSPLRNIPGSVCACTTGGPDKVRGAPRVCVRRRAGRGRVSNDAVYRSTVQPLVATIFRAGKARSSHSPARSCRPLQRSHLHGLSPLHT